MLLEHLRIRLAVWLLHGTGHCVTQHGAPERPITPEDNPPELASVLRPLYEPKPESAAEWAAQLADARLLGATKGWARIEGCTGSSEKAVERCAQNAECLCRKEAARILELQERKSAPTRLGLS